MDRSRAETSSEIGHKRDDSQTHQTVDLGAAKLVMLVGMEGMGSNVIAGTHTLKERTTATVLETHGIPDICPTTTRAEVSPVWIAEDPALSTEDSALFTPAT